jgi:phosphohistidine phosphatase SixA
VVFDLDLYLLRHGDAGKIMSVAGGGNSGDVPLTILGRDDVAIIARSVKDLNLKFNAIVTSPLKRAEQTAKIIAKVLAMEKRISIWNELVPEGNRSKLYNKLNQYTKESTILIIEEFTTGSEKGTGLGLYICKTIIEGHGGKIWGENNDDRGATFSFSLPAGLNLR